MVNSPFKGIWGKLLIDVGLNKEMHKVNEIHCPLCVWWPRAAPSIWLKFKTHFREGPEKTGHSWWENSSDKDLSHRASLMFGCCSSPRLWCFVSLWFQLWSVCVLSLWMGVSVILCRIQKGNIHASSRKEHININLVPSCPPLSVCAITSTFYCYRGNKYMSNSDHMTSD